MTTPNNTPSTPIAPSAAPTPSYNPQSSASGWGQISAGPQAFAFPAMMYLMSVLNELMDFYNEQNIVEMKVQSEMATASSTATKSAAEQQAYATIADAANSFAGAAVSGIGAGLTVRAQTESSAAMTDESTFQGNLKGFDEAIASRATNGASLVSSTNPFGGGKSGYEAEINALTKGTFSKANLADTYDVKDNPWRSEGFMSKAKSGIAYMSDEEFAAFKAQYDEKMQNSIKAENTASNMYQSIASKAQMYETLANNVVGTAAKGLQSSFQMNQGQDQAVSSLANTTSQMAGGVSSNALQQLEKEYDEEMQALSLLQQIAASNKAPV